MKNDNDGSIKKTFKEKIAEQNAKIAQLDNKRKAKIESLDEFGNTKPKKRSNMEMLKRMLLK